MDNKKVTIDEKVVEALISHLARALAIISTMVSILYSVGAITLLFIPCLCINAQESTLLFIVAVLFTIVMSIFLVLLAFSMETAIGGYRCKKCGHLQFPTTKQLIIKPSWGTSHFLRCDHCQKHTWHTKDWPVVQEIEIGED